MAAKRSKTKKTRREPKTEYSAERHLELLNVLYTEIAEVYRESGIWHSEARSPAPEQLQDYLNTKAAKKDVRLKQIDRMWGQYIEGYPPLIEKLLRREGEYADLSARSVLEKIVETLDEYWSFDEQAIEPLNEMVVYNEDCRSLLADAAPADPHELAQAFFALGWKAQEAFKGWAWHKSKKAEKDAQSASVTGTKKTMRTAAKHKKVLEERALDTLSLHHEWLSMRRGLPTQIARTIVRKATVRDARDGKHADDQWVKGRNVQAVARDIKDAVEKQRQLLVKSQGQ